MDGIAWDGGARPAAILHARDAGRFEARCCGELRRFKRQLRCAAPLHAPRTTIAHEEEFLRRPVLQNSHGPVAPRARVGGFHGECVPKEVAERTGERIQSRGWRLLVSTRYATLLAS
jgi:hypothetical protein